MLHSDLKKYFPGNPRHLQSVGISYKRKVDDKLISSIDDFILKSLDDFSLIGLRGIVVGVSGGADSVLAAMLLKRAIGRRAFAVIVDFEAPGDNANLSRESADRIGIDYVLVKAGSLLKQHLSILDENSVLSRVHLRSRLVNNIIFQVADNRNAAVAETTNKSEALLNIYAESFRGHLAPLGDLYKSELYDLADYFSLPELRERQSGCPDLLDVDAFGVSWDVLDPVLHLLVQKGVAVSELVRSYGFDLDWLTRLKKRISQQPIRSNTKRLILPRLD